MTFGITLIDGTITNATDYSTTVTVSPVENAPTITGVSPLVTMQDNQTINPFPTVSISDVDDQGQESLNVSITLDVSAKGTLITNSPGITGFTNNNGIYSFTGISGTNISQAIESLVFVPTENYVPVGLSQITTFTVTVSDGFGGVVANNATQIRVASVSGLPKVLNLPSPQPESLPLSSNIYPFQAIQIADPTILNIGVTVSNQTDGFVYGSKLDRVRLHQSGWRCLYFWRQLQCRDSSHSAIRLFS